MTCNRSIAIGTVCGLSVMVLLGHYYGPDARYTTAPGDNPTGTACVASTCHVGTLNSGGGNVTITFPSGLTYTPGSGPQTLTITINDPPANGAKLFGFEMTARLDSDLANGQAGNFTAPNLNTQVVLCAGAFGDLGVEMGFNGCPAGRTVQFIEHNNQPFSTNTINVLWTPPATNVGNIHIYVAANAAPSSSITGTQPNTNDHIYSADYVLTPAAPPCTDSTPSITNVQSAGGFNASAGLAPGTWLEIYGSNLTCAQARLWAGSDFNGSNAPTSLNNVSVTIDGIQAYVDYISSTQVNVQAPDDTHTGSGIPIVLTNGAGSSNTVSMQENTIAPALLAPAAFNTQGHQWVVAQHATDQTYVGKPGLINGLTFSPAKAGETIIIYGIGFGPVKPATPAGVIVPSVSNTLTAAPSFHFGQTAASLQYDGLVPGFVGLYQFNVVVPKVGTGDMQLNVTQGSVTLNQNLYITVGQ